MSATVAAPFPAPGRLSRAGIVTADPVRAVEWAQIGALYNYLTGRASVLVPTCYVGSAIAATATHTWRIKAWARYQATHRLWILGLRASTSAVVTFTDASSDTHTLYPIGSAGVSERAYFVVEEIGSRASGEVTMAPSLAVASGSATVTVTTIACVEIARPELAVDASDDGVDLSRWAGGVAGPITDADLGLVAPLMDTLRDSDVRNLFCWIVDTSDPIKITTASPSWSALFAAPPVVLARQLYASETTRAVEVRVYARASDGSTTGSVRVTMASGATATITGITTTTWAWYSTTVAVHVEDLASSDGRRSTTWDTATFDAQRTAGGGEVQFASCILTKG
jgi:hypothetical protein